MGKKNMWKTFFWKILSKFNTFVKRNTTPILNFYIMENTTTPITPGQTIELIYNTGSGTATVTGTFNGFLNVTNIPYFYVTDTKLDARHHWIIPMPEVKAIYFTTPLSMTVIK